MITKGLLMRLEAKPGEDEYVEQFLGSLTTLVRNEPDTIAWFAVRFGRSEFGIFDVFADESARETHLAGEVTKAVAEKKGVLFLNDLRIEKIDVIASKLPEQPLNQIDEKALLLIFETKPGREQAMEQFLKDAKPLVEQELGTTAWFAFYLKEGIYGIFDSFPDNNSRFHHLTGRVPMELTKHAITLLGSLPDMSMLDVKAEEFGAKVLAHV